VVVIVDYLKLLKGPIEDNKALMTASYLLSLLTISIFLLSILPFGLLIWLEGKMLTNQHFYSAFYPHQPADHRISKSAFYPRPGRKLMPMMQNKREKFIWMFTYVFSAS